VQQASELISYYPKNVWYVSFIHDISLTPVPISGPGTSHPAPMNPFFANSNVYLLVNDSISLAEYYLGSILIPPFAPPYGKSTTEHFNVIKQDKASTS